MKNTMTINGYTNFEQGITGYIAENIAGDEVNLSLSDIESLCRSEGITLDELLPDFDTLVYAFKKSKCKSVDEWLSTEHPCIKLEDYEYKDFE